MCGVRMAIGGHKHAKRYVEVVRAAKDCYVETPFAYWAGKRLYWNAASKEIIDERPA